MGIESSIGGGMMAKMTKAQEKRMVKAILQKTKRLYMQDKFSGSSIISVGDMAAIEKLCAKWMKRIG